MFGVALVGGVLPLGLKKTDGGPGFCEMKWKVKNVGQLSLLTPWA
jgi:hypothetical protein